MKKNGSYFQTMLFSFRQVKQPGNIIAFFQPKKFTKRMNIDLYQHKKGFIFPTETFCYKTITSPPGSITNQCRPSSSG